MEQKERTVFAVTVKSKHFLADFLEKFRNDLGLNLKTYERLIEDGLEECYEKLHKKYPNVYDIKFTTAQMTDGAAEIICYGKLKI